MKKLIAASVYLSVCAAACPASDFEADGIGYSRVSASTVSVSGADKSVSGAIAIPAEISYGGAVYAVAAIDERAFEECAGMTSVTIPSSVSSVGNDAFSFCSALREVVFADGGSPVTLGYIPNLNAGLFADTRLATLYLGRDVSYNSRRGYSPFSGLETLSDVTIGAGVARVGQYAFSGCVSLSSVTMLGANPPLAAETAFDGVGMERCVVTVPVGAVPAYKEAPVWSGFPNITDGTASAECVGNPRLVSISASAGGISLSGLGEKAVVSVCCSDGRLLAGKRADRGSFELNGLAPGVYVVTVADSGEIVRGRVLVR